ncbi:hypothetical protein [Methylocystis bryophila]|uniref:Uncharacterized protein n=1 Tax=Methylocystis bryophila TaxID=655015 RepID=A0A1W6MX69_9HYPH|nr:hypothetical protein [Methylocystis bryophila]ARN82172.1 hypothetical protein B1812_14980 [Methylocystis bryophila]BDV38304.1 hypothetical protein DSM21852_15570 [Methylocystis bryophila]
MIAHYCQCSGEAWSDVLEAELTFPRLFARQAYWREFPPPPMLMRAIAVGLGVYKPAANTTDAMGTLKAMFPGGKI